MQHQPHHHRFVPWQKLSVYTTGALLVLTGSVWLAVHYLAGAGAGELPHPLEAWTLQLHGLAAYAALFALGAVAATHVPQGWRLTRRQRRAHQRRSGLVLCILVALLAFTGYLLYYFAPEWIRPAMGWVHAAAGAAVAVTLVMHRQGARRSGG